MDEGDLEPEHALSRLGVDQLGTPRGELGERYADVVDLVGDVVHAGAALREEPSDRRVLAERRQQLDAAGADAQGGRLDALLLDPGPMLEPAAEEPLVRPHRLVQVGDRHADVVDPSCLHSVDAM